MKNESITAIVACVAIVGIVAISSIIILAIFCYRQENIRLLGKHKNEADMSGKVKSEIEWEYDSTQNLSSEEKSKKENDRKVSEADLSNSNL